MGKAPVKKRKQRSYKKGSNVYFLAFTKDKQKNSVYYICKGEVVDSPSEMTRAPHKVRIVASAISKLHNEGTEENGRSLLGKTIHLNSTKLQNELSGWLVPDIWWYL